MATMWHDTYADYVGRNQEAECGYSMEFYYVSAPEQPDNGQGIGMGIRMYLGPGRSGEVITNPSNPGNIPGPPIVLEPPYEPPPPPPPPNPTACTNNTFPLTCPGNGIWNFHIWEFSDYELVWPSYMEERVKAGAFVAGKVFNDGSVESCIKAKANLTGTYPSHLGSPPNGTAFWNDLYGGREYSWNGAQGYDNQADVRYFRWAELPCGTLASAGVPGNFIRLSRCWYTSSIRSPNTTAANIVHEWSHNMGYGHPNTSSSEYPYAIGNCVTGSAYNTEARTVFPGGNW